MRVSIRGKRPRHEDRRLQSIHDLYGFGFDDAMIIHAGNHPPSRLWRYVGKRAADEQYMMGLRDGALVADGASPPCG